jgi:hypothetical protein
MIRSRHGRRLPAELARDLPLAPRERVLRWAEPDSGGHLVVTVHGFWRGPPGTSPADAERLCWREVGAFHADPDGSFSISRGDVFRSGQPGEHLYAGAGSDLPEVIQAMVDTSRLVEKHYRLPSGSRLLITARDCPYQRVISWASTIMPADGADPDADAELAGRVLDRARAEYGSTEAASDSALSRPVPVPNSP